MVGDFCITNNIFRKFIGKQNDYKLEESFFEDLFNYVFYLILEQNKNNKKQTFINNQ